MKKILSYIAIVSIASASMTGCIDETIPTNTVVADELASSAKATEALLWAMPAFTNSYYTVSADYAYGYGSIMHIRDVMTNDMAIVASGYDWYLAWEECTGIGEDMLRSQFIWNYYWKFVQTSNNMIRTIDKETATPTQLNYLGVAYAFRAMQYLDMGRMFEFLPTDINSTGVNADGNNVMNLTVPIVTETMTEEEAKNNPRRTRDELKEFILSDLDNAEEYLKSYTRPSKVLPDLSVVYGLKARLYMWIEDYPNAATYARKAIDTNAYRPLTQAQWLSKTAGFNTFEGQTSWMWGSQMMEEDDVVQTGIRNWTSWICNETTFGYAGAGPFVMISANTYNRIADTDFRKLSFKAPKGHALEGKTTYIDDAFGASLPDYASTKFRPNAGDMEDFKVGASSAYPLMRIEEMYLIEAEAKAHSSATEGKTALEAFMKQYRDPAYVCAASSQDAVIEEIFFQKSVELWGEGQSFFDYKRLDIPIYRGYTGTNYKESTRINTMRRPAWMNICIVQTERMTNTALEGFGNPNPSGAYIPWSE